MEPLDWIDLLAQQARREVEPEMHTVVPRIAPAVSPLPRAILSLSAVGSLAAACLLLVMGLHAQQSTTASPSQATSTSVDPSSALFSPLKMGLQ